MTVAGYKLGFEMKVNLLLREDIFIERERGMSEGEEQKFYKSQLILRAFSDRNRNYSLHQCVFTPSIVVTLQVLVYMKLQLRYTYSSALAVAKGELSCQVIGVSQHDFSQCMCVGGKNGTMYIAETWLQPGQKV